MSTGIQGLDDITPGGLPRGGTTLVCGGPGCGKALLAMEFLIRGATEFNEPGVCMSFEETAEELSRNVMSLGFDVDRLMASNKLAIECSHCRYHHAEHGSKRTSAGPESEATRPENTADKWLQRG